ncbi:MAG: hypothetical protein K2H64_05815 [Desulfovibrio sp.]|nr:hypothetical protein [Desulfovibrio sp.]
MPDYKLSITFLSDWSVGSGLGDGAAADSVIVRDADGLPYLPGRAIKGALRESAWRLALADEKLEPLVDFIFGGADISTGDRVVEEAAERTKTSGRIRVGSGQLPADLREWLLACDRGARVAYVGDMTSPRRQTSLDKNGQVVPATLRTIECGIPGMTFECDISLDLPNSPWLAGYIDALCAGVKSVGGDRSRGLGRCRVTIADSGNQPVRFPSPPPEEIAGELK